MNKEYIIKNNEDGIKSIYAKKGFNWSAEKGFFIDPSNKETLFVKTFNQAQDDSMFCSLDISSEEHENMKKLYYLIVNG
ncbi:MAG: hypothetical protein HRT99_00335 [Mycoplasmatales bacterium]|nr:hypothetical protein [Mycoplasmatales bacterium]